jgi:small subunit ribosomal protein S13
MAKEKQAPADKKVKEDVKGKEKGKGKKPAEEPQKRKVQEIIRLAETNLDGGKKVKVAIRDVRGVSFMFSNAVTKVVGFGDKRLGELSEHELSHLEDVIANPGKFGIPAWLYNRKRDPITGKDAHLTVSKLELRHKMDINEMKKLKSYRGVRHIVGLRVRGQRTGSGSGGKTVGVSRKKQQPAKKKK